MLLAHDLPEPDVLAAEIAEDLQDAMEQFAAIAAGLGEEAPATFPIEPK